MTIFDHLKPWIIRLVVLLVITVGLSGCSTTNPWDSQEAVRLTSVETQAIAKDVVDLLLNEYPLEKTIFALNRDKRIGTFGKALESQLRKSGYALAATHSHARTMTYLLDNLAVDLYRVDIRVAPTYRMGLIYRLNKDSPLVLSSVTVRSGFDRTLGDYKTTVDRLKNRPVYEIAKVNTVSRVHHNVPPKIDSKKDQKKDSKLRRTDPVEVASASTLWAVQVISLAEDKTTVLETIRRRVVAMGYQAAIVDVGRAKKVRVGPFGSLAVARPVLDEMRTKGYPDAFLWKEGGGR